MLTYSNDDTESIRQLIADGANQEAIDALYPIVADDNDLQDTVVMLKNRLATLKKSVREGTIGKDEENVERNMINRSLLDVLNILEDANKQPQNIPRPVPSIIESAPQGKSAPPTSEKRDGPRPVVSRQTVVRGLLALATIIASVLIERGINGWLESNPAKAPQDLVARLVFRPDFPGIRPSGMAKAVIGKFETAAQPISPEGVVRFAGIPAAYSDDSVRLQLFNPGLEVTVNGQSAPNLSSSGDITFYLNLITKTYKGKVLYPNSKPAAGVVVEIENEPARDTTDADGNFALTLPASKPRPVWVVLRRQGKPVERQDVELNALSLKVLKIPY